MSFAGHTIRRLHRLVPSALFLIAILLSNAGPLHAGWVALDTQYQTPRTQTIYVDPGSIKREGSRVSLWQLTDIKWLEGMLTPKFLSVKVQKQFECTTMHFRVLAVVEFSRQMATGKSASGYIENGNWQQVEQQSVNQGLREVACRKP
jgi:hypothetical protein